MYRVLLVDDEPLVLAGIKSILNWQEHGCELAGNARNGKQALEVMKTLRPDIVIADINMPVMNGIELLKNAEKLYPEAVFIMLTNLQEFELALESLRHRAIDYLVKTQLEQESLTKSLMKAKAEANKRRMDSRSVAVQGLLQINETKLIADGLKAMLASNVVTQEIKELFLDTGVLNGYRLLSVQLRYPDRLFAKGATDKDFNELYQWEGEVLGELSKNCFSVAALCDPDGQSLQALILIWGGKNGRAIVEGFYKKLVSASASITGIEPCILATGELFGPDSLPICREQIFALQNYFYMTGEKLIFYGDMPHQKLVPLGLSGIAGILKKELRAKNTVACLALFERAASHVRLAPHEKSQALWLCTEMFFAVFEVLGTDNSERGDIFSDKTAGYAIIKRLSTREDVARFLDSAGNELQSVMQPGAYRHAEMAESVKQFIYDNIDKRITLIDAAKHICLSAGYLSAIFKKQCGESFVDFVNRRKVEKACELLKQKDYLISQVSDMLSFENAYYFARIFKRYMGITPSQYREQLKL
ncbi:MAG: response regulator [Clostridiales bacterium]|jgi:two-component system response regulator YesN|nr:response regulator [Clostridiales bacterium]